MISRYSRPEMAQIWSDQYRYELWLKVELAALEAMAAEGLVPKEVPDQVRRAAKIDPARVLAIEAEVKHDVIAFLTSIAESVGPASRFVHRGMTSNDVLDSAFALQLAASGELILKGLSALKQVVRARAEEQRDTVCVGRSHGMHAEPITFGLKLAGWFAELTRAERRLGEAIAGIRVGKISGAVGTYASLPPSVEAHALKSLGLVPETVATQVVARDRHAAFFSALALLGCAIERCCVEIRHLQRSEVGEVEEPFGSGQKGSSAMPHKRNPILSENLVGLARLLRGYSQSALENVALWHERDISHSSVERVIAPDAAIVADFMLHRFTSIVRGMVVHPDRMRKNLDASNGLVFSGTLLIALADSGLSREAAYALVQKHAFEAARGGTNLRERVEQDTEILKALGAQRLGEVFELQHHLKHVPAIMERAFRD